MYGKGELWKAEMDSEDNQTLFLRSRAPKQSDNTQMSACQHKQKKGNHFTQMFSPPTPKIICNLQCSTCFE